MASVISLPIILLLSVMLLLGGCTQNREVLLDAKPADRAGNQPAATKATALPARQSQPAPSPAVEPFVAATSSANPFGLLLGSDDIDDPYRIALIKALGVTYFRPWYVNVEDWSGACYDLGCDLGPNAGL